METVQWFKRNYPELIQKMKDISHDLSSEEQSPYHSEGDIYTHTLMVYNNIEDENDIELELAALLHDIGKPFTQVDKGRNGQFSFTFHENISVYLSIDILKKFEKDFGIELNKEKILYAIGHHQILHKIGHISNGEFKITEEERIFLNKVFGDKKDYFDFMVKLGRADSLGRISNDRANSKKRYEFLESRFYLYNYHTNKETKSIAYILSGLPTAGKTNFSEKKMKENPDIIYLSIDNIMKELFSKGAEEYNMYYSKENSEVAKNVLFKRLKDAVKQRKDIIVDNTNLDPLVRNRNAGIIPDKYYEKRSISFLIGEKDLKDRNEKRKKEGKYISETNLWNMAKKFELPTTEYFHSITLTIN